MHEETHPTAPSSGGKRRDRVIAIRPVPGADLPADEQAAIRAAIAAHGQKPGGLIEVLHAVQATLGCIPPRTVSLIAFELNLTRAEVHGVISFYHDFRDQPPDRPVVQLCRAEACQAVGARALEAHLQSHAEAVELAPVYCLGNCALGPSAMIDGRLHGRLTAQTLDRLLAGTSP
jgi:formate dehydrogenase subunit gamma